MSEHERPVEPFSDLHVEEGHVRATLLHDPTVEGLDMGLYLDGSGSMSEEYEYKKPKSDVGFLDWLFGWKNNEPEKPATNMVEPEARWMLEYLATKDRNGLLRVAYWACGQSGKNIEVVGELEGKDVARYQFPGPRHRGNGTHLAPAIRDYMEYYRAQLKAGAKRGCAVFITDGELHDADAVKQVTKEIAKEIASKKIPMVNFVLVGVGDAVNDEQLEQIAHEEYPGVGHIWCHRVAGEINQVAELVAVLVDETMTVAAGGTIYDDKNRILKQYEGRLPAVLEFEVPEGCESFTLEINGQRYTQPLPEDDDHHGEEH